MWLYFSPQSSLLLASSLAASFVLSLYVWSSSLNRDRDHPSVIQQRLLSTGVITLLCAPLLYYTQWQPPVTALATLGEGSALHVWLGFPSSIFSNLLAAVLALLLTASLFLGPLVLSFLYACRVDQSDEIEFSIPALSAYVIDHFRDLVRPEEFWKSIRNYVAAPLVEEIVFRSAILAILAAGGYGFTACVFLSPFLFGAAHLHHLINIVRSRGIPFAQGVLMVSFQLFYTSVFGLFAGFLYLRTGHIVAAIVAHTFCNLMGFPELRFMQPAHFLYSRRHMLLATFLIGIVAFIYLLYPLTEPTLFGEATVLLHTIQLHEQRAFDSYKPAF